MNGYDYSKKLEIIVANDVLLQDLHYNIGFRKHIKAAEILKSYKLVQMEPASNISKVC